MFSPWLIVQSYSVHCTVSLNVRKSVYHTRLSINLPPSDQKKLSQKNALQMSNYECTLVRWASWAHWGSGFHVPTLMWASWAHWGSMGQPPNHHVGVMGALRFHGLTSKPSCGRHGRIGVQPPTLTWPSWAHWGFRVQPLTLI